MLYIDNSCLLETRWFFIVSMWLSGNSTPDFRTINDFRGKRLKEDIKSLFSAIVLLLQGSGYVSLDVQYIDGTKMESASNRYTFVWRGSVEVTGRVSAPPCQIRIAIRNIRGS